MTQVVEGKVDPIYYRLNIFLKNYHLDDFKKS